MSSDAECANAVDNKKDNPSKLIKPDTCKSKKCENCASYVTHSASDCPYKTNYNKKKFRFENNSFHTQSLKRKIDDSAPKSVTKRLPSRWDVV